MCMCGDTVCVCVGDTVCVCVVGTVCVYMCGGRYSVCMGGWYSVWWYNVGMFQWCTVWCHRGWAPLGKSVQSDTPNPTPTPYPPPFNQYRSHTMNHSSLGSPNHAKARTHSAPTEEVSAQLSCHKCFSRHS